MTDSRADVKAMIRDYMTDVEADYLDAVRNDALDEAVRDRLVIEVERSCERMVGDGRLERIGVIRKLGQMAMPAYRLVDPDGELARQGLEPTPTSAREIAEHVFPLAFRPPVRIYSRWEDAMTEQLRLYDFIDSYNGREYMTEFEKDMNAKHPPQARVPGGLLWTLQEDTLAKGEPVYIAAEVCNLIDHARTSFEVERVSPADPFVPSGFCLLAKPIMLHNVPGTDEELLPVRCIAWTSMHSEDYSVGSFWISFYGRVDEVPQHPPDEEWFGYPIFIAHMFQWTWGERPTRERTDAMLVDGEDPDEAVARAVEQGQLVQTLWRLAQQFVPAKARAPRPLRREARRKLKRELTDVNVMVLRRPSYDGDFEPSDRHYEVTFLVRGYWARRHTREGVRQVWVRPHIKGQGPFKETTRAWEFRR